METDLRQFHPRPDYRRNPYFLLDGEWDFCPDPQDVGITKQWPHKDNFPFHIKVPFHVESQYSGVEVNQDCQVLWYLKRFDHPLTAGNQKPSLIDPSHQRVHVIIGAVDYHCTIYVNGEKIGEHQGGYTPVRVDITDHLQDKNILVLRVEDSLSPAQVRGKQTFLTNKPFFVWYPQVRGVWQSVYLEIAGQNEIKPYQYQYEYLTQKLTISLPMEVFPGDYTLSVKMWYEGKELLGQAIDLFISNQSSEKDKQKQRIQSKLALSINNPRLWSAESPHLYDISFTLTDKENRICDYVESYIGLRQVEWKAKKIWINGELFYHKFLLNQGYFPGGDYTPQDWTSFEHDILLAKDLGFNGFRMHQKIENPRFLYDCDRLGFYIWEEMPSFYYNNKSIRKQYKIELQEMLERDAMHPSIICWVIFNESWGISRVVSSRIQKKQVRDCVQLTRSFDPTRPVVDNSGWEHVDTDIVDYHHYLPSLQKCKKLYQDLQKTTHLNFGLKNAHTLFIPLVPNGKSIFVPGSRYKGQPIIISEYGGFGFAFYQTKEKKEMITHIEEYTQEIINNDFIAGFCYTQFADTFQEKNGLFTENRALKVDKESLQKLLSQK